MFEQGRLFTPKRGGGGGRVQLEECPTHGVADGPGGAGKGEACSLGLVLGLGGAIETLAGQLERQVERVAEDPRRHPAGGAWVVAGGEVERRIWPGRGGCDARLQLGQLGARDVQFRAEIKRRQREACEVPLAVLPLKLYQKQIL